MQEIYDVYQRDFKGVWIPREIYLDTRLNALDKIIFTEIDSLSKLKQGCFASNAYLAKFCQCSERKISESISKLKKLGYIEQMCFDGRTRFLQSRLAKIASLLQSCDMSEIEANFYNSRVANSATLTSEICDAGSHNLRTINIDNNIDNKNNIIDNIINNIIYNRENSSEFSTQDKIPDQNQTKVSTTNMPSMNIQNASCLVNDGNITPQTPDPLPPAGATNVVTKNKRGRKNVIEGDVEIEGQRMADNDNEQSRANKEKQIEKAEKKKVSTEEKKKSNARKMAEGQIKEYTENEELRQTFLDFVDSIHDGKIGQIVSKTRVSQWLKILDDCSSDSERIRMLEVSIGSGYGTLYIQDNTRSGKRNRGRKIAKSVAETTSQEDVNDEDIDAPENWRHMIF